MRIKVAEKNREKIDSAIQAEEGKARERCVDFDDCMELVELWERDLDSLGIIQANRRGARYTYREAIGCNSYKHAAQATRVVFERGGADWFLVGISRENTGTSRGHASTWRALTERQIEAECERHRKQLEGSSLK